MELKIKYELIQQLTNDIEKKYKVSFKQQR